MGFHFCHIASRWASSALLAVGLTFAIWAGGNAHAQVLPARDNPGWHIGVKSNLLSDLSLTPDLGVEVQWAGRWSAGVEGSYVWLRDHTHDRHWRIEGGNAYLRHWWPVTGRNNLMTGHHLGVYGQLYTFQVQLADSHGFISGTPGQNLWGKPWWACGVEYGYSINLSGRLNLDLTLGIGYAHGMLNRYGTCGCSPAKTDTSCDCGPRDRYSLQHRRAVNWVGPTKASVSLVWVIGPENRNP